MTQTTSRSVSPLQVAKNRWEEASRVTDAYKNVTNARTRRAYTLHGTPGELQAWANVAEAEAQLEDAQKKEATAWADLAWEERAAAEAAQLRRERTRRGR